MRKRKRSAGLIASLFVYGLATDEITTFLLKLKLKHGSGSTKVEALNSQCNVHCGRCKNFLLMARMRVGKEGESCDVKRAGWGSSRKCCMYREKNRSLSCETFVRQRRRIQATHSISIETKLFCDLKKNRKRGCRFAGFLETK